VSRSFEWCMVSFVDWITRKKSAYKLFGIRGFSTSSLGTERLKQALKVKVATLPLCSIGIRTLNPSALPSD
jgi:hypothetical protein